MALIVDVRAILDKAFAEVAALDKGIAGNWTVSYELYHEDGEPCLARTSSEASTAWLRTGMLHKALEDEAELWQSVEEKPWDEPGD